MKIIIIIIIITIILIIHKIVWHTNNSSPPRNNKSRFHSTNSWPWNSKISNIRFLFIFLNNLLIIQSVGNIILWIYTQLIKYWIQIYVLSTCFGLINNIDTRIFFNFALWVIWERYLINIRRLLFTLISESNWYAHSNGNTEYKFGNHDVSKQD